MYLLNIYFWNWIGPNTHNSDYCWEVEQINTYLREMTFTYLKWL